MNKQKIVKIYNFFNDDTLYYSASLSFFTIFSLLPILALLIVVVSNMPIFDQYLSIFISYILDFINPTHSSTITSTINQFLSNANQLGFIGIFYLLFVFTLFFNNYEDVVNKIFHTEKRAIYTMFFLYIAFLIIIPILFIIFIVSSAILDGILLKFVSFIALWVLFTFIFKISPNSYVSTSSSIIGSFVTLATLSLTKQLFIVYVVYNTTYSTIYGSFSILLFFFLWIYISWTIYLYGMKLTALLNNSK